MLKLMIPEIFEAVRAVSTRAEKVKVLLTNDHPALRSVLKTIADPKYTWDLPEGVPPFKTDRDLPKGYAGSNLYSQARLFYIWDKNYTKVKAAQKEQLFINMLEGLHWTEADFICLLKDGKLNETYGIDIRTIKAAFPTIVSTPALYEKHQ